MGVRFVSFFIVFFVFSSIFLFYKKVKTLHYVKSNYEKPIMQFNNVKTYIISNDGIKAFIEAKMAKRFKDRDELYFIHSNRKIKKTKEQLSANKGILKNNFLYLYGNVIYKNDQNITLTSNTVIYNIKKDILSSKTKFKLIFNKNVVIGKSFIYFKKQQKLFASNIKANIIMEKK